MRSPPQKTLLSHGFAEGRNKEGRYALVSATGKAIWGAYMRIAVLCRLTSEFAYRVSVQRRPCGMQNTSTVRVGIDGCVSRVARERGTSIGTTHHSLGLWGLTGLTRRGDLIIRLLTTYLLFPISIYYPKLRVGVYINSIHNCTYRVYRTPYTHT